MTQVRIQSRPGGLIRWLSLILVAVPWIGLGVQWGLPRVTPPLLAHARLAGATGTVTVASCWVARVDPEGGAVYIDCVGTFTPSGASAPTLLNVTVENTHNDYPAGTRIGIRLLDGVAYLPTFGDAGLNLLIVALTVAGWLAPVFCLAFMLVPEGTLGHGLLVRTTTAGGAVLGGTAVVSLVLSFVLGLFLD